MTGEPLREVNFYLPTRSVAALKLIPGFESFDPNLEVLHCDKPGTGSVDAPRAFHLKLATILRGELNFTPCKSDEELLVLHSTAFGTTKYTKGKPTLASRNLPTDRSGNVASNHKGNLPGDLVAIVAIHVDDLKFAGPRDVINWIITCLEATFGKLITQWHSFTNCGDTSRGYCNTAIGSSSITSRVCGDRRARYAPPPRGRRRREQGPRGRVSR